MKSKRPPEHINRIFPQLDGFSADISIMQQREHFHSVFEAKMHISYPTAGSGVIHRAVFLFTELKQNAEKHSKRNQYLWYGAAFHINQIEMISVNRVSEENKKSIQSEITLAQEKEETQIREIIRKRNQTLSSPGTGILQMFLKASVQPEFVFEKHKNEWYVLIKIVLYVRSDD